MTESLSPHDPNYRAFAKIFEAFKVTNFINSIVFYLRFYSGNIVIKFSGIFWLGQPTSHRRFLTNCACNLPLQVTLI